jgi:pimeloyl-ACP methyl ester carboxylesterase
MEGPAISEADEAAWRGSISAMIQTLPVRHGFATVGDRSLHQVEFSRPGRRVLLLHGVTGSAWDWHHVAREIAPIGSITAVDLRGHGDSEWSAPDAYTTADHVADLGALIGTDSEPVDLVGYSWGALICVSLASRLPDRIRRLVVVDVEPSFDMGETDLPPLPARFTCASDALTQLQASNPNAPPDLLELLVCTTTRPGRDGALIPKHDPYFLERWPFRSDDHWDEASSVDAPTLLVHAGASFVRGDVMKRFADSMPRAELVDLPETHHVVPVDNPSGLARVVQSFLH